MKNNSLNSVGDSNISSISNGDYSETTDDMMMNSFENSNTEKCQVELDSKKFENDLEINDDRSTTLSISCEDCGKSFKGKQSLKFHIDSVHKGIKYSCESCGKSYTQKAVLNRHVKTLHGGIFTTFRGSFFKCTLCHVCIVEFLLHLEDPSRNVLCIMFTQ